MRTVPYLTFRENAYHTWPNGNGYGEGGQALHTALGIRAEALGATLRDYTFFWRRHTDGRESQSGLGWGLGVGMWDSTTVRSVR